MVSPYYTILYFTIPYYNTRIYHTIDHSRILMLSLGALLGYGRADASPWACAACTAARGKVGARRGRAPSMEGAVAKLQDLA